MSDDLLIRPWRHLEQDDAGYGRRYALFRLAAPVFEEHGYRGATIAALAHACHLSPAGLYHWFASKKDLATWLLRKPRLRWDSTWVDPDTDRTVQLIAFVEIAVTNIPYYLLALRLLEEIEGPSEVPLRARTFHEGEIVFARLVTEAAPEMVREDAVALARDLMASLVGSAFSGLDRAPEATSERLRALLRARLVPMHIASKAFDDAIRRSTRGTE